MPERIVSNGPFVLDSWLPDRSLTVIKNKTYWDAENVALGRISFVPSSDDKERYDLYMSGEADWVAGGLPGNPISALRSDHHVHTQFATYYFEFNHSVAPLGDSRVRKALSMAIDRNEITDNIVRRGQIPAYRVTPPLPDYDPPRGIRESVDDARRLLAEAGYPDGNGFPELTILYNTSNGHGPIVDYLRGVWKNNLGITVHAEDADWNTVLARGSNHDFDILRMGWVGDYPDVISFLRLFETNSMQNFGRYSNPEFDRLVRSVATLPVGGERQYVLKTAEEILIDEDSGVLPIYYFVYIDLFDDETWGGWYPTVLGWHPWKHIYLR